MSRCYFPNPLAKSALAAVISMAAVAQADVSLEKLLLKKGVITQQELNQIENQGKSLEDLLLDKGVLTQEEWRQFKTEKSTARVEQKARPVISETQVEKVVERKVEEKIESEFPVKASWGEKGFRLETRDGNWATNLQWRAQMRYSYPYRSDPRDIGDFLNDGDEQSTFELRRVRMKIGGHGYRPWLKYYFEVDLQPTRGHGDDSARSSSRVIDWRISMEKYKFLSFRAGQWKIDYNRERVDSSGKQQFVERSIVNRIFTLDRQMGVMTYGHLLPGTFADSRYYVGVFTGEGRGVHNDDDNMMYLGRLQWNFLGRDLKWSQSDVEFHEQPAGSVAFAAATTIGRCTRWSSSGCGNLDGYTKPKDARDSQFKVRQMMEEVAFKWQGFSLQHEFHWKQVIDRENGITNTLRGSYAQVGYFFHNLIPVVPKPLELAFRYAFVDEPNENDLNSENTRREYTAAANWFFAGHRNKVTVDYSHLTLDDGFFNRDVKDDRVRVQWDVSF